ncbi:MAG: YfcC family protein, partial [Pseudomonadota bacterium]
MDDAPPKSAPQPETLASRFPTAYTILFLLIIVMAGLTWIIPAGRFDRVQNEAVGREVAVAGTYKTVEPNPQGFIDILLAPTAGFYDPDSYAANAIDVSLFVLFLGGFLGVVNATGSIDTGIRAAMRKLKGREIWMLPILMSLFALGGTTYGMAEETLAFYPLLIPAMLVAGFDTMTAVAVILLGAGIGTLGSTINPFATVIASNAAGVAFTEGMVLRFVLLLGGLAICIAFVMRYALRVKADPGRSVVARQADSNRKTFLSGSNGTGSDRLSGTQSVILVLFAATFAALIWGVSSQGWWMAQMGALFLGMAILVGLVARLGEKRLTATFVDGARD